MRRFLAGLIAVWAIDAVVAATHEIEIGEGSFHPDQIAIEVGDRIDWVALSPEHTVVSDDGLFDSTQLYDTVPFGDRFSFTFLTPGTYRYYCTIHGAPGGSGMAGVVVVTAGTINQPPSRPTHLAPLDGAVDQALTPVLRCSAFRDPDAGDFHAASQWVVRAQPGNEVVYDSGDDSAGRLQRAIPAGRLAEFTTYSWQVRQRDGRGAWSAYSAATTFRTLQPIQAVGTGLKASYWNLPFEGAPLAVTTNAVPDAAWGTARPHRRITADAFATRWEGWISAEFTERYELEVEAQGQVRLWISGEPVVDAPSECPFPKTRKGWVDLVAGKPVPIRIDYIADVSGGRLALRWSSARQPSGVVPTQRLFPVAP
jgi:plastocyanin